MAFIQLIEEEPLVREVTQRILELAGYEVHAVATIATLANEQQLCQFYFSQVQVMIVDLAYPADVSWLKRLCQQCPRVPIIVTHGWGTQIEDSIPRAANVLYVLAKPYSPTQLLQMIRQTIA